jgi:hypothetical protein
MTRAAAVRAAAVSTARDALVVKMFQAESDRVSSSARDGVHVHFARV